jgi:anti-anti-sigma factor
MSSTDNLVVTPGEGSTPSQHVYIFQGPLTLGNLFIAQEALRSTASVLVLDFTGVPFVDSSGVGALVQSFVKRKKQGQRLVVVGPNETVQKLFRLTAVDALLEIVPNLESVKP